MDGQILSQAFMVFGGPRVMKNHRDFLCTPKVRDFIQK